MRILIPIEQALSRREMGTKMQDCRTYYFPADSSRVRVGKRGDGQFGAHLVDDDRSHIRGKGHTHLAAIADLNDALDRAEAEGETEFAEAAE